LIDDVRRSRQIPQAPFPLSASLSSMEISTDWLVRDGKAKPFAPWACFHTSMFALELEGVKCGIIARTIGGPYAVLIAEQLHAAGAKLIVGLTSAAACLPTYRYRASSLPPARFATKERRITICRRSVRSPASSPLVRFSSAS